MKKKYRNKLPKGAEVKGYIAHVDNGEIVVEVELKDRFQPKDGDFLYCNSDESFAIFIYKDVERKDDIAGCYCSIQCFRDNNYCYNLYGSVCYAHISNSRYATKAEKDNLLTALEKECNKRWNAEKKCLEDIRWKPKDGELFWFVGMNFNVYSTHYVSSFSVDSLRVKTLNCFRTEQAAQKAANQIKDIFKNSKAE